MTHYQLTYEEARADRNGAWIDPNDYKVNPQMLCRSGDGHAQGTRTLSAVDCRSCMAARSKQEIMDWARTIKGLGFSVYLAKSGTYGFIADEKAERVLSFSFTDGGSLSGNYGPASQQSGTGWRMDTGPYALTTYGDIHRALYTEAPAFCGKGWKHYTTVEQYLAMYGSSSQFTKL